MRDGQFAEWLAQRSNRLPRGAVKGPMLAQAEDGQVQGSRERRES